MFLRNSLSLIFGRAPAPRRARSRRPTRRLHLEPLDDRALPSGSVSLATTDPDILVGERVTWTATAVDVGAAPVYRFSAASDGEGFHVLRDFSPANTFAWTPMQEGSYDIQVTVKEGYQASETTSAVAIDEVSSLVSGSEAVVTPTLNPLVALYSVPPSSAATVFVQFAPAGDNPVWRNTDARAVEPGKSTNFFVAGMLPNTTYQMRHVFSDGTGSAPLLFTTGALPSTLTFPTLTASQPPGPGSDTDQDMVLHSLVGPALVGNRVPNPIATDLSGRVEWYFDHQQSGLGINTMSSGTLLPGGTVIGLGSDRDSVRNNLDVLREIDLAGNPVRETNLAAVNAQLTALGHDISYGFHHEVQRLPNGDTVVLALTERKIDINGTPTNYIGDLIVVLDEDFQVAWVWDAFDHLDVNRGPVLGEIAIQGAPGPDSVVPDFPAVSWLHDNAVSLSPADGNLILSVRHQDWVIKVDYRNGAGDGHVVWRLGQGGDFTVNSADPNPWFSHQHNAHYIDDHTLILFDNGNTRRASDPNAHNRGQVWMLDETSMTATPVLNADLGEYADRFGSAQRLSNGNYSFTSGALGQGPPPSQFGRVIEVLPDGTKTYVLQTDPVGVLVYRSYRTRTLYEGIDDVLAGSPRKVESVAINDGSAQRSMVKNITVTFNGAAILDPGAIELRRQDGSLVNARLAISAIDGKTVAVLTFVGSEFVGGSLADGNYSLSVRGDLVHDRYGRALDGDSDGTAGGDRTDAFFRLFGDSDGDRDVDARDLLRFLGSFGSQPDDANYLEYFDVNSDGRVGLTDLVAFARRLGTHLNP
jgi:arylsulfate sulfotransferase